MTRIEFQDRSLGMLWGAHCGDSLGATLEFGGPSLEPMQHRNIIGQGPFNWTPGAATDDTDLMLLVLQALTDTQSLDFEILKSSLIAWADSLPKDIGNTTKKGIENLRAGLPLRECGYKHPTMYGNGSIMRAAPLALYEGEDWQEIVKTQCLMTHGHDLCVEVDLIYIQLLKDLLKGSSVSCSLEKTLNSLDPASELSLILHKSMSVPWSELNTSGHAAWTLGAGLWALKKSLEGLTPEEILIQVVNRGDDSDTCGAVTGALLGAAFGTNIWPVDWLQILQKKELLQSELERILSSAT
nr:ADP-ribosylglycohydrolase family protein [Bdellovibrio sp. HAGR004]